RGDRASQRSPFPTSPSPSTRSSRDADTRKASRRRRRRRCSRGEAEPLALLAGGRARGGATVVAVHLGLVRVAQRGRIDAHEELLVLPLQLQVLESDDLVLAADAKGGADGEDDFLRRPVLRIEPDAVDLAEV